MAHPEGSLGSLAYHRERLGQQLLERLARLVAPARSPVRAASSASLNPAGLLLQAR